MKAQQLSIFQQGEDLPLFQQAQAEPKPRMTKEELAQGDRVVISSVFYPKHEHMIGKVGTIERVYKTKDEVKIRLDDGDTWHATPCNLQPAPDPQPAESEPMPDCPLCHQSTEWHHYPDGAPSVVTCRKCGELWGSPEDVYQPEPKPKRKARKPFTVKMTFQDPNMPAWIQKEPTEDLAGATLGHWFATIAGIKSITIDDDEKRERHVYTPAGYLFTVPIAEEVS